MDERRVAALLGSLGNGPVDPPEPRARSIWSEIHAELLKGKGTTPTGPAGGIEVDGADPDVEAATGPDGSRPRVPGPLAAAAVFVLVVAVGLVVWWLRPDGTEEVVDTAPPTTTAETVVEPSVTGVSVDGSGRILLPADLFPWEVVGLGDGMVVVRAEHSPHEEGTPPQSDQTILAVDSDTGEVLWSRELGDGPSLMASAGKFLWVAHWYTGAVSKLDLGTGEVLAETVPELPYDFGSGPDRRRFVPNGLELGFGSVWMSTARGAVARIDMATGNTVDVIPLSGSGDVNLAGIAASERYLWVAGDGNGLYRLDPTSGGLTHLAASELEQRAAFVVPISRGVLVSGNPTGSTDQTQITLLDEENIFEPIDRFQQETELLSLLDVEGIPIAWSPPDRFRQVVVEPLTVGEAVTATAPQGGFVQVSNGRLWWVAPDRHRVTPFDIRDTGPAPMLEPLMADAVEIPPEEIFTDDLRDVIAPRSGDRLFEVPVSGDRKLIVRLRDGAAPHLYGRSCYALISVELPAFWDGTCLELRRPADPDVLRTGEFSYAQAFDILGAATSLPESGPMFGEDTGMVLLFDDGLDGLLAVDPDRRLAARSVVDGQRAGDEPYSMIRVGDSLVVGWSEIFAVDITTRDATSLGFATIFVPAAEPGRVWMIDYPGGRIGQGELDVWQVTVDGEQVTDPVTLDVDGFPAMGIPGGLAVQTGTGLVLWDAATGAVRLIEADGAFVHDVAAGEVLWCEADCPELIVTNVDTMAEERYRAPTGYGKFLRVGGWRAPDTLSPDGRYLAALVGPSAARGARAIWVHDRQSGSTTVLPLGEGTADYLTWAPDGDQLFATSWSYGSAETAVWRYRLSDGRIDSVGLPFGGALSPVVIDAEIAEAYFGTDLREPGECRAPRVQPSGRTGICTFGF